MPGIIINLPYTAGNVPPPLAKRLELSPEDWQLEHWRLIDPHLARVVREAAVSKGRDGVEAARPVIAYPFSPVVADPWGLWAAELGQAGPPSPPRPDILPKTTAGRALQWSPRDRELIFGRTVLPFYQQIEEAAARLLADSPLVLILTLRSHGSHPLKFEVSHQYPRPQVAVGSTAGLTPEGLANLAGNTFRAFRWWPELNWPHGGGDCLPPALAGRPRV
ncbi:MAG: N-formylglutamate amidohydrolase, partial [Candidatus Adiutrix sp.]|nr:N-formylglutamate amidohydrolase [Candidatus Adiutrix sp.]